MEKGKIVNPSRAKEAAGAGTAPGIRLLREVWNIPMNRPREAAPAHTISDIYCTRTGHPARPPKNSHP
jgi:hypothetical protein